MTRFFMTRFFAYYRYGSASLDYRATHCFRVFCFDVQVRRYRNAR